MAQKEKQNQHLDVSRRNFLKTVLYTSPVVMFGPGCIFGNGQIKPVFEPRLIPKGRKIRVATIGVYNRGTGVINEFKKFDSQIDFVAFADVLFTNPEPTMSGFEGVPCYTDYRQMFEEMHEQIDAVIVCTPDHSHFSPVVHSMLLGKHVYVEKPLAQNVYECRLIAKIAKATGVVTQLGNQGHSGAGTFQFGDWVEAGLIKNVRKIDSWMTMARRWHGWTIDEYPEQMAPLGYDWDQWLDRRPFRPHSDKLTGGNWRCWYEFGCGCMGDWGAHVLDAAHRFLQLGQPYEIETSTYGPSDLYYPQGSVITFRFKARGDMPPLEIRWFDGQGNLPDNIPAGYESKMGQVGSLTYSEDYAIRGVSHGAQYSIIDPEKAKAVADSGKMPALRQNLSNHYHNFLNACQGIEPVNSPFEIGAALSETLCLGCIGQRYPGVLKYDAKTMTITNHPEANKMIKGPEVRPAWRAYDDAKLVESKASLVKKPEEAKWENLVDSTMSKWENPYEWGKFEVINGEVQMTTESRMWFLCTKKDYANFIFECDVKMPEGKGNSGIQFRSQKAKNSVRGYQAEVDPSDRAWSGGIYDQGRRMWFVSPNRDHAANAQERDASIAEFRQRAGDCFKQGQWNKYRIECLGSRMKVYINGVLTTDFVDQWSSSGTIALQHHGERDLTYEFRNARIKDLGYGGELFYPHREEAARKAEALGIVANTLPGDVYEAEAAVLHNTVVATNHRGYQGTGFADSQGAGSYVHFDNVLAGAAGEHKLIFRYAAADNNRACELFVNDAKVATLPFASTGNWTSWKNLEIKVNLKQGRNSVKVVSIGRGPNLDAMAVTR